MEQTPEEVQGPQRDEPQRVNGWLSIGFVAAFGGMLLAIGLVALLSAHVPGVGQVAFVIAGGAMLLVAARSAIRTYGIGAALLIVLLAGSVGGCFGASLVPVHGGAAPIIRAQCQNNLKQFGLVVAIYASEHPAHLAPPLPNTPGRLMFSNAPDEVIRIYPDILTDLSLFYCPGSEAVPASPTPETAIDDHTYFYLGYEIRNQMDLEHFAAAYREVIAEGGTFESKLRSQVLRACPDNRKYIAARPELSEIPLLIERPLAHIPGGSNVVFADGHVEFIKMNAKWPVTQAAMDVLLSLDALGP